MDENGDRETRGADGDRSKQVSVCPDCESTSVEMRIRFHGECFWLDVHRFKTPV